MWRFESSHVHSVYDVSMTGQEAFVALVVRLPRDLHERLRRQAVAEERSMAAVVRRALRAYMKTPIT